MFVANRVLLRIVHVFFLKREDSAVPTIVLAYYHPSLLVKVLLLSLGTTKRTETANYARYARFLLLIIFIRVIKKVVIQILNGLLLTLLYLLVVAVPMAKTSCLTICAFRLA